MEGDNAMVADELMRLREAGATGVLQVSGANWPDSALYLMDGEIIACCTARDPANLERILLASGLIEPELLQEWRPWIDEGADLIDMMLADGNFPGDELMVARSSLFDDNFAWTLAHPQPVLEFEAMEAVFPDNIQFDLDGSVLIGDVMSWLETVAEVLSAASNPSHMFAGQGQRPEEWTEQDWAQLCSPRSMADLLDLLGPPRTEAAMLITEWLSSGLLGTAGDDYQPPADAESDYDRAARGEFVRSYEVLDKVDLTGVPILGLGDHAQGDPEGTLDHQEGAAIQEDTLPPLELGEYSAEATDPPDSVKTAPVAAVEFVEEAPPQIDNWEAMSEEPPPILNDEEFVGAESWDHIQPIGELSSLEMMDGSPPPVPGASTHFGTSELAAFSERINTFNNIFGIIFETFATSLGEAHTRTRFDELLTSSEREHAALFTGLAPAADGTLDAEPLIARLAELEPDSPEDYLKAGLYDLLFSHLSDSKDLLPGEIEATMMERLVVFERQLNHP
ncbi:MAG: hypothetical protein CMP23_04910 [Rickettsiales bacterium]|nr:hypothetical protein [Rickettsiales bacterium]